MNCHPSECYQTCNFGAVSMQHIFFQPASFSFSTLFFLGGYAISWRPVASPLRGLMSGLY